MHGANILLRIILFGLLFRYDSEKYQILRPLIYQHMLMPFRAISTHTGIKFLNGTIIVHFAVTGQYIDDFAIPLMLVQADRRTGVRRPCRMRFVPSKNIFPSREPSPFLKWGKDSSGM